MNEIIDCLIIGHNEMDFAGYEGKIRKMGTRAGAFRDLDLNFVRYNNKSCTAAEIFNLFYYSDNRPAKEIEPLTTGETFSAAIAYLGTYLHRRGFTFDFVNSFRDNKEELAQKLTDYHFRTIAVTTTLYVSAFPVIEIMDFVRTYDRDTKIIVGGPFIHTQYRTQDTVSLDYLFQSVIGADFYVISSRGEAALVEILSRLKNNLSLSGLNNVCFKTAEGYEWSPVIKEEGDLSGNMVDWDLFAGRVGKYANLRTAISCPYSCAFCGFPQHAGKYRVAGVEEIEEELQSLDKIGTVESVHFIDDTFNIPVKRFKEILRMLIKNKFGFKWYSHFRCQFADRETVALMKESGCEGVFLGIESGSPRILENMNKSAGVEKYRRGIDWLRTYGILTYGSFIIGFPGETAETAADTTAFIKKSGLDFFRAQLWYCDPITPIWRSREKYQLDGSSFEWTHSTMNSHQAADLVESIFMEINEPLWVPQYNFECDALFHLLHRGLDLNTVKNFIDTFNHAVKEKLKSPPPGEMSLNSIHRVKESFEQNNVPAQLPHEETNIVDRFDAGFDF